MPDFSSPLAAATPLHIPTTSQYGCETEAVTTQGLGGITGKTWIANLIAYIPFAIPFPYPLKRFFWLNGSPVTSTNVDCGIYSAGGARLANTGSTVMVGANAIQYAAPTTTMILSPGMYYLAWSCNNTTSRASCRTLASALQGEMVGLLQETPGVFGLPATMTPVAWANLFGPQFCGITRTASGF